MSKMAAMFKNNYLVLLNFQQKLFYDHSEPDTSIVANLPSRDTSVKKKGICGSKVGTFPYIYKVNTFHGHYCQRLLEGQQ